MHDLLFGALGLLADRAFGDPQWLPHPVAGIGRIIGWLDRLLNRASLAAVVRRVLGVLTVVVTVGFVYGAAWYVLDLAARAALWMYPVASVGMIWTTLAWRGLDEAARDVHRALAETGLEEARRRVGRYVGRDTTWLSEAEVVRATVETVAENTVDALVSPLLYACVGGAPLALAYRAVNTLDSMVGYRNERYRDFGWAAARLDDVANFIPARLAAVLLLAAIRLAGLDAARAWRVMWRDARRHPSPNAGIPESLMAGALGVQLGGVNVYGGRAQERARMGLALRPLATGDIIRCLGVLERLGWLCLGLVTAGWLALALR